MDLGDFRGILGQYEYEIDRISSWDRKSLDLFNRVGLIRVLGSAL
jgi:hypothetical protein